MSDDHIDGSKKPERAGPREPDERDEIIERLERAVADEREKSSLLLGTIDGLQFRLDVLEKGYAKQLDDARLRRDAAERELSQQQARLAELESSHEEISRLLTETRGQLERVAVDRERLRMRLAGHYAFVSQDTAESQSQEDTINRLLTASSWARERPPASDSHPDAKVAAEPEGSSEELLAPELVFPKKSDDDAGQAS